MEKFQGPYSAKPMVLILDGNSEIGGRVRSNLYYLDCLMHFIDIRFFFYRKDQVFLMRAQHVLRYHILQVPWQNLL